MKKNKLLYRVISGLLSASLLFSSAPFFVYAESKNEKQCTEQPGDLNEFTKLSTVVLPKEDDELVTDDELVVEDSDVDARNEESGLPPSFSGINTTYMPEVRNQGILSSCWAFAAIGAIEIYTLKNNIKPEYNKNTIDYSERHLIYDMYNRGDQLNDPLGNTQGDYTFIPEGQTPWYDAGGNLCYVMWHLLNWAETELESNCPYNVVESVSENGMRYYTLDPVDSSTYYASDVHVQDVYNLGRFASRDVTSRTNIKNAIMEYGSVIASYRSAENERTNIYNPDEGEVNHIVLLVGWDDDFPRENFTSALPEHNGAWLMRNSWGNKRGNNGYYWISYEDMTLDEFYVLKCEDNDNYDHNFHHDGSGSDVYYSCVEGEKIANVYVNNTGKKQYLSAVGLGTMSTDASFNLSVYINPDPSNPATGTKVKRTEQQIRTKFAGYYTVKLNEEIIIPDGATFSIVFELNKDAKICAESSEHNDWDWIDFGTSHVPGTSFKIWNNVATDMSTIDSGYTFRLKAYTTDYYVHIDNRLDISIPYDVYTKKGTQIRPEPTVVYDRTVLSKDVDYDVEYGENIDGTGWVRIIGKDIYRKIDRKIEFIIADNALDMAVISFPRPNYDYTSYDITPLPTVMLGSRILTLDVDYSIEYSNNVDAGDATITLTGVPDIAGTRDINFVINKAMMTVTVDDIHLETCDEIPEYTYSILGLIGADAENSLDTVFTVYPEVTCDIVDTFSPGEYDLIAGNGVARNYNITYVAGRLIVVPKYTFSDEKVTVTVEKPQYLYTGELIEPEVTVTYEGRILTKGTDYVVSYTNNKEVGIGQVIVNGIREYFGEAVVEFEILDNSLFSADIQVLGAPFKYDSLPHMPEVQIILNGKVLEKNKDYIVAYQDNVNAGQATIVLDGAGDYRGHTTVNFTIDKAVAIISAHDKRILDPKEEIHYTYDVKGLLGNDTAEGLFIEEPVFYVNTNDKLTDGDYVIAIKGGISTNYTFGYEYAKLRVGQWYTITVKQNEGGEISPGTIEVVKKGEKQFVITADEEHVLSEVLVDGIRVEAHDLHASDKYPLSKIYVFKDVKDPHVIEAKFLEKHINIVYKEKIDISKYYPYYKFVKYKGTSQGGKVLTNRKGIITGDKAGIAIVKPKIKVKKKVVYASVEPITFHVTKPVFNKKAMKGKYAGQVIKNDEFFSIGKHDCKIVWSVIPKRTDIISIDSRTGDVTVLGTGNGVQKIVATFTNSQGYTFKFKMKFKVSIPGEEQKW